MIIEKGENYTVEKHPDRHSEPVSLNYQSENGQVRINITQVQYDAEGFVLRPEENWNNSVTLYQEWGKTGNWYLKPDCQCCDVEIRVPQAAVFALIQACDTVSEDAKSELRMAMEDN